MIENIVVRFLSKWWWKKIVYFSLHLKTLYLHTNWRNKEGALNFPCIFTPFTLFFFFIQKISPLYSYIHRLLKSCIVCQKLSQFLSTFFLRQTFFFYSPLKHLNTNPKQFTTSLVHISQKKKKNQQLNVVVTNFI